MKFEYADKEQYPSFRYGACNNVGTYPLGAQFNWHGGMHINEDRNSAIKAIADGTIIAYRLNKEPIETNNGLKFSSGFVLIQHQYKSPKGRELTFYSLYNHLMPYNELKEFNNVPDIFKTQQYEVSSKTPHKAKGVTAYKSISKMFSMVLPVNSIVNPNPQNDIFDKSITHWAKNTPYKKVIFTHPDSGLVYDDLYVDLDSNQFEKVNDNMHRVVGNTQEGKCWDYENLRSTPTYNSEKSDENFVMQVPNKSKFTIEKKSGNYYKIKTLNGKEQEGYIYAKSCKEDGFVIDFDENNLDKIITGNDCNIPVKAGDIVGFTGLMGHIGNEQHRTTHLEVFSATDPTEFLKGKDGDNDDIADTKDFIKIAKGAMISHHYPYTLKSGDEILVLQVEEEYSRIKLNKQFRTVEKADLGNGTAPTEETGNYTYTSFNLDKINEAFDGTITKDSVITLNEDAEQIAKGQTSRDVSYTLPNGEHCYWVHKNNLPSEATMMGQYFTLNGDIDQLFESKPNKNFVSPFFPNDSETQTELMGDHIIGKKEVEEIKQGNQTWYEIKTQDYRGERKGYIKSDDEKVSKVSAHDWTAFGFKVLKDQPDNFIFDETEKNAPQFLKSVFKEMDTDGNKKLSPQELRRGLNDMYVCERLSKLVCYHQSEWGVNYSSLKQELETLLDKGIEQEEDEEIKEHFIKQKENSLKVIEDKVNALDFWSKVKAPGNEMPEGWTYDPILNKSRMMYGWEKQSNPQPRGENDLEPFPIDTKVYHFHPNAFVEQMRRIQPNCFCNKDITVEAFEKILGTGPWFTGKAGIVDMKRDYPDVYNISTQVFVDALNAAMKKYEIHSCLQKAHFLAQCYHESGYFKSTAEYGDGSDYDVGSHKALHDSYANYCTYLKKYSGLASTEKYTEHEAKINTQYEKYKKAYEKYNKATAEQKLTNEYKELKDMHDNYPVFKTEKEKFDLTYENSYKYSSSYTAYQNWRYSYNRYSDCIKFKNTSVGDGKKYRGRGLFQLTWKTNYNDYKEYSGVDCVNNPKLISNNIKNACDTAGWHWLVNSVWNFGKKRVNEYANNDDLLYSTIAVNGGFNGFDDRYEKTQLCLKSFGCKECANFRHLDLGNYSLESSKLNTSGSYKSNGDPERELKRQGVNDIISQAKYKYKDKHEK